VVLCVLDKPLKYLTSPCHFKSPEAGAEAESKQ
jgi:hypothetical protein